jgi:gliding motility-associated-like protein
VEEAFSIEKITLLESTADTMLYEGEPFSLSVTLSPPQLPGATFEWYLNDSLVATTTDTFLPGLQAPEIFEDLDSLNFTVVVTDAAGCEKSETGAAVVHNNPVDFPNVFTPNGDMVNDFFLPVSQQPVSIVELKIWNRWGQLVYDNASPGEGWNGEQGGKPAVSDVYVYSVKYRIVADSSAVYSQKGEVTLLR